MIDRGSHQAHFLGQFTNTGNYETLIRAGFSPWWRKKDHGKTVKYNRTCKRKEIFYFFRYRIIELIELEGTNFCKGMPGNQRAHKWKWSDQAEGVLGTTCSQTPWILWQAVIKEHAPKHATIQAYQRNWRLGARIPTGRTTGCWALCVWRVAGSEASLKT